MTASSPRTLVLTNLYPPQAVGGYELACQRAVDDLRALGHDVTVLTSDFALAKPQREGHVWRELRYEPDSRRAGQGVWRRFLFERHNQAVLRAVLRQLQPDLVFVWSMWGLGMALLLTVQRRGVPILYYVHDNWLASGYHDDLWFWYWRHVPVGKIKRLGKRFLYRLVMQPLLARLTPMASCGLAPHHVAFISEYRKQECLDAGWPVADARVIYNGIDLTRFYPACQPLKDSGLRVLFASRLVPAKGAHVVLEALADLVTDSPVPVSLTVAGGTNGGDMQDGAYLRQLTSRAGLPPLAGRVRLLGMVAPDTMPEVYRDHDVFVFASSEPEGFPLVLLEAMASGLAVVSTTVGGAAEILAPGQNSLTFDAGNVQRLADCLRQLMTDSPLRHRISEAGLATVRQRFALRGQLGAIEELIHESVKGNRHAELSEQCRTHAE